MPSEADYIERGATVMTRAEAKWWYRWRQIKQFKTEWKHQDRWKAAYQKRMREAFPQAYALAGESLTSQEAVSCAVDKPRKPIRPVLDYETEMRVHREVLKRRMRRGEVGKVEGVEWDEESGCTSTYSVQPVEHKAE